MIINPAISLKSQTMVDGVVIPVPFLVICKTSSQMCSHEADLSTGIIHSNSHGTLVAGHSRHSSLLHTPFNIFYLSKAGRLDENAKCSANKLSAAKKNVALTVRSTSLTVQSLPNSIFPSLFPRRIAVHYLLGAELHDFLKSDSYDLRLPLRCFNLGSEPS